MPACRHVVAASESRYATASLSGTAPSSCAGGASAGTGPDVGLDAHDLLPGARDDDAHRPVHAWVVAHAVRRIETVPYQPSSVGAEVRLAVAAHAVARGKVELRRRVARRGDAAFERRLRGARERQRAAPSSDSAGDSRRRASWLLGRGVTVDQVEQELRRARIVLARQRVDRVAAHLRIGAAPARCRSACPWPPVPCGCRAR